MSEFYNRVLKTCSDGILEYKLKHSKNKKLWEELIITHLHGVKKKIVKSARSKRNEPVEIELVMVKNDLMKYPFKLLRGILNMYVRWGLGYEFQLSNFTIDDSMNSLRFTLTWCLPKRRQR